LKSVRNGHSSVRLSVPKCSSPCYPGSRHSSASVSLCPRGSALPLCVSCVLFRSRGSAFHVLRRPQLQIGGRLAFCHLAASGSSSARADPGVATPSRAPGPRPAPASWSCSCPGARRRTRRRTAQRCGGALDRGGKARGSPATGASAPASVI
ncbi:hypothetical protein PVAP13_7NG330148, partial [Panicum virgatum]